MKNISRYKIIMMLVGLIVAVAACNREELFEREQYKNVFALLSDNGGYNIYTETHDMGNSVSVGCVTAAMGGTLPTTTDVSLTLVEDPALLKDYNIRNFDLDESKYARALSPSHYRVDNYTITIKAGERRGLAGLSIRAAGLSPDSTYFIPFRVTDYSECEINPAKSTVLYRVLIRNDYAEQTATQSFTRYSYRGNIDGQNIMGEKFLFPIDGKRIRMTVGNQALDIPLNLDQINQRSILLTVDDNKSVKFRPWKNVREITPIDTIPEYPNRFVLETDDWGNHYKKFLLAYAYTDASGAKHVMQEELYITYNEESKYE